MLTSNKTMQLYLMNQKKNSIIFMKMKKNNFLWKVQI